MPQTTVHSLGSSKKQDSFLQRALIQVREQIENLLSLPGRPSRSGRTGAGLVLAEHYLHKSDEVVSPNKTSRRTFWILSRSLYRVKTITLANVAANRRANAIQLELAAWTPFRHTGHYVVPQGINNTHALLMAWDQDAINAAQSERGVAEQDLAVIPEGALRAANTNGAINFFYVNTCLDGVEAVVMQNGVTTASQWWSGTPNQAAWANFQRVAGIEMADRGTNFPQPLAAYWLARPLGYARGEANAPDAAREAWIIAMAAFVLAIPTLWIANDFRRHAQALSAAEARLSSTEQQLDGLLGARGNAVGSLARVARFDAAFNQSDPLTVLADVSRSLSQMTKPGVMVLSEWDWRGDATDSRSKRLKMIFTTSGPPPSTIGLVKAFEANPQFRDVQVNADGSRLIVEMRVEPVAPEKIDAGVIPTPPPSTVPTPPATEKR